MCSRCLEEIEELKVEVSGLEDAIRMLTEERDLARELFQGMVSEYADLLGRHAKMCDDYDGFVSRYDDLLLRDYVEND